MSIEQLLNNIEIAILFRFSRIDEKRKSFEYRRDFLPRIPERRMLENLLSVPIAECVEDHQMVRRCCSAPKSQRTETCKAFAISTSSRSVTSLLPASIFEIPARSMFTPAD